MLLELCFYLVKLRRAGGHHCHGTGNVARSEANCAFLFPKQGMRAPGATSQSLSELGQAQTHPPLLLIALLSCCGFTVKTVPVSTAKSSHDRQQPGATASRQCPSRAAPFQASALRFPRENLRFPRRNPQALGIHGKIQSIPRQHCMFCYVICSESYILFFTSIVVLALALRIARPHPHALTKPRSSPAVCPRKSAISPAKSSSLGYPWQNPVNPAPALYVLLCNM